MKVDRIFDELRPAVDRILEALDRKLTVVDNLQAKEASVADSGPPLMEFTITHNLGKIPRQYIYNLDRDGIVFDSRRDQWTTSEIYLKCSVGNAKITLTVL